MRRSAQQPPTSTSTSTNAQPGSDGEEAPASAAGGATGAIAEAATVVEPEADPEAAPEGDPNSDPNSEPAAENSPESRPESRPESGADPEVGPEGDLQADPAVHPEAAAEAKSRLPALVRTVTATAIGKPQRTGPVGQPGKAVLAGAALGGVLLVSVPFLLLGGDEGRDRAAPTAAETVLSGNSRESPGEFAVTEPDASASGGPDKDSGRRGQTGREASAPAPAKGEGKAEAKGGSKGGGTSKTSDGQKSRPETPKTQSGEDESVGDKSQAAKGGSGVTLGAPVSLRSHLSGRCIDVPGGDFSDGKKLFVWDCNNGEAQQWRFASDGTVRIKDKCLDVAGANFDDGTPIQIAWCSGNIAQKFVLNGSHDLVNTVVGKCVDIKDNNRGSGAWLQLWSCAGTDNQKWSV
ncbi:hypothetical protein QF026_002345 [Streptomyces aurantiacus]|uniref:ricin-type beta-trefoil lectin domain protein n=1 Tax=Streptomyces aurantiacus TaxID=47760 RepID=UPI00278D8841|nr:ricin-type beta-trefoil lectin domain protein [Streptomyces aurantiacus]MDQ0773879.1 hypothetical protein [Streptomyces aurantiacus]